MASAPPHKNQLALPVQDGQFHSSPSQYPPQQQQQHPQQPSSSAMHSQQTGIAPHLTQINPGVGPSSAHQLRPTAPPAAMAHPQQQPQLAGPSNGAAPNGGPAYAINQQEQMDRRVLELQRRYNDVQARNMGLASALQAAQQQLQVQQRDYNNIMTSWNEYKDANEAYKAEHERDTQRIKDLEETLAAKTKLVDQGWAAMATWKDAHQKETQKGEEMKARMNKLAEQLNKTHLEGMQWKACALSWNDPKGEFQQGLVQAISTKLGEQFSAREKTYLEKIRELEHQVNAYRRMFPDAQLPPVPPPPPPPAAAQPPQQPYPSRSNQPPPHARPIPPQLNTSGPTAQSPMLAGVAYPDAVGQAGSSSTSAAAMPVVTFVASPSEMQARFQQQQYHQQRMLIQQQQQQMPGPSSSASSSRPPAAPSDQQQQQGPLPTPASAPLPATRTFPDSQHAAASAPLSRHALRVVPPNQHLQHPSLATSPVASNLARRASLPISSPSQQISPDQMAYLARNQYIPPREPMNPQQILERTASTGSSAPPAVATGPSGSGSGAGAVPSASPIYWTNGRPAGFVAPRATPAIPQKRPASSEALQQQPMQPQPPPIPEWDLDDVIEIPVEEATAAIVSRQAELGEEGRLKKRAKLDGVEKHQGDTEDRDQSPDIPLSVQRRASLGSILGVHASGPTAPTAPIAPPQPSPAVTLPAAVVSALQPPEAPTHPPIMTRNQRTDSTASNLTIVPPLADGSVSPPLVSPGPSSHRPSPEIGRLVPVVLNEPESEDTKGDDDDDDDDDDQEMEKTNAGGSEVKNGQAGNAVMSGGEALSSVEAAKQPNAMDLDEPDTPASAEAQLQLRPPQHKQSTCPPQPLSMVPPAAPPIAVLPPDDEPESPSTTEPGELKESPPIIKSELLDEPALRHRSTLSLEEGEVSRTQTPAVSATATAETPTVAGPADVNMNDVSRAESEDVKPVIGAGGEIVPKTEATDSAVVSAPNVLLGMASGSQEEPIEIPDEMAQDGVIIDFLAVLFGVVENDDTKVECQLCSRRGSTETFSREDLGALVQHCEDHHQRAWKVRVLDVLEERGIQYTPIVPTTA
ncbi:hypothetical protein FS837_001959 [Tulasnella sp. UAMH 9824]|nr:hypothetical protein FS837_001959 [Tulasnella sp. UAMH 9824]